MSIRARIVLAAPLAAAFALFAGLLLPLPANAQSQAAGGEIDGTVAGEAGALPGARGGAHPTPPGAGTPSRRHRPATASAAAGGAPTR